MSNPNTGNGTRQLALLGVVVVALVGVGLAVYKFINSDAAPQTDAPASGSGKPERMSIAAPGDVRDRDAWRTKAENDIKALTKAVGESTAKSEKAEKQASEATKAQESAERASSEAKKELETLKKRLDNPSSMSATPGAQNPYGGTASQRSSLNQPLPNAVGANRVLNPPGTFAANNPIRNGTGMGAPMQSAFEPKGGSGSRTREIEIAEFESLDKGEESDKGKSGESIGSGGSRSKSKAGRGTFIPASTFVKASQLYGVLAPVSGQGQGQAGNPLPMVFELTDLANLPNLRKLNATGCRVLAAATGDLSSERVYPRLEVLSCVLPNNEAVEMRVKGHVIGEDGNMGIRGNLISKSGRIIGAQIAAAFAKGVGEGFRNYATTQTATAAGITQTIDPNRYGYAALGSGAAGGADALAQYYIKLSNQMFPVLEAEGGRIVELVFSEGVDFPRNLNDLDPTAFAPANTRRVAHEIN
jgi:conjugal transfer pilus assembly protein TraB